MKVLLVPVISDRDTLQPPQFCLIYHSHGRLNWQAVLGCSEPPTVWVDLPVAIRHSPEDAMKLPAVVVEQEDGHPG